MDLPLTIGGRPLDLDSRYNLPMSPKAQEILEQARRLSPDEQDWLAECLLIKDDSIGFEEAEAAWSDEIKRRLDEIDAGEVEMIPGDEVMARMLNRLSPEARARLKK